MRLHKFKITVEDLLSKEGTPIAVLSGSVHVFKTEGDKEPEVIHFMQALDTMPSVKKEIRGLITEALTLKGLEEDEEFTKMFTRSLMPKEKGSIPTPRKRVTKKK